MAYHCIHHRSPEAFTLQAPAGTCLLHTRTPDPACPWCCTDDSNSGCRLAPLTFDDQKQWGYHHWAADKLQFFGENDTLALQMPGVGGPRVWSNEFSGYGLYSATMRVSGEVGVITAFYVSCKEQRLLLSQRLSCVRRCMRHAACHGAHAAQVTTAAQRGVAQLETCITCNRCSADWSGAQGVTAAAAPCRLPTTPSPTRTCHRTRSTLSEWRAAGTGALCSKDHTAAQPLQQCEACRSCVAVQGSGVQLGSCMCWSQLLQGWARAWMVPLHSPCTAAAARGHHLTRLHGPAGLSTA